MGCVRYYVTVCVGCIVSLVTLSDVYVGCVRYYVTVCVGCIVSLVTLSDVYVGCVRYYVTVCRVHRAPCNIIRRVCGMCMLLCHCV